MSSSDDEESNAIMSSSDDEESTEAFAPFDPSVVEHVKICTSVDKSELILDWNDRDIERLAPINLDFPPLSIWKEYSTTLKKLSIIGCPYPSIPVEIGLHLGQLKELSLAHCGITSLPSSTVNTVSHTIPPST